MNTAVQLEYGIRVRLPGGKLLRSAPFFTTKARAIGDLVRLPLRADGELHPGQRSDWRVAAIEDGGKLLVLEFLRTA